MMKQLYQDNIDLEKDIKNFRNDEWIKYNNDLQVRKDIQDTYKQKFQQSLAKKSFDRKTLENELYQAKKKRQQHDA